MGPSLSQIRLRIDKNVQWQSKYLFLRRCCILRPWVQYILLTIICGVQKGILQHRCSWLLLIGLCSAISPGRTSMQRWPQTSCWCHWPSTWHPSLVLKTLRHKSKKFLKKYPVREKEKKIRDSVNKENTLADTPGCISISNFWLACHRHQCLIIHNIAWKRLWKRATFPVSFHQIKRKAKLLQRKHAIIVLIRQVPHLL